MRMIEERWLLTKSCFARCVVNGGEFVARLHRTPSLHLHHLPPLQRLPILFASKLLLPPSSLAPPPPNGPVIVVRSRQLHRGRFLRVPLDIRWIPEDRVTLFTSEGIVQIGGSLVLRRVTSDKKPGKSKISQRFPRFQESDYMDPDQGLCLGALFDIAATNGLDMGRRLCILGFCRSIEMLSDVVEDTVLELGGEVVAAEKALKGGLHEKLTITVALPLLWGVPPASETLHLAVRSGGGIVDKVFWQWDFC